MDWWVIYKEYNGLKYVYMDSRMTESLGLSSDRLVNDVRSPLSRTVLSSGFPHSPQVSTAPSFLSWNDQQTRNSTVSSSYAHAKV